MLPGTMLQLQCQYTSAQNDIRHLRSTACPGWVAIGKDEINLRFYLGDIGGQLFVTLLLILDLIDMRRRYQFQLIEEEKMCLAPGIDDLIRISNGSHP